MDNVFLVNCGRVNLDLADFHELAVISLLVYLKHKEITSGTT